METLLKTDFSLYMCEAKTKTNITINIDELYKEFIIRLLSLYKTKEDKIDLFFILNYTRTEFIFIQSRNNECFAKKK
jgi:hypothetical protein